MTEKHDGTGDPFSGNMEDFTFDGKDFTIEISGLKVPRKDVTPSGEWINMTIARKAHISYLHSQERIDGVLYQVTEARDEAGIAYKQYTRADLLRG